MLEKFKSRGLARFSSCAAVLYRLMGENGCRTERDALVMVAAAAVVFFFIAGSGAVKCSAVRCRHTRI